MLIAGIQPVTYADVLIGLTKRIYDNKISSGSIYPETALTKTVGGTTYTEAEPDRQMRIFKAKLDSWASAQAVVDEITIGGLVTVAMGIPVLAGIYPGATTGPGTGTIS